VGARFSPPVQTGPRAHTALCTMGTGTFPGVESGRGVTLTPHPHLVLRSKNRVELLSAFLACKRRETYLKETELMISLHLEGSSCGLFLCSYLLHGWFITQVCPYAREMLSKTYLRETVDNTERYI
jgi:hypothetical protein